MKDAEKIYELSQRIKRKDLAQPEDYKEYQALLLDNGVLPQDIKKYLQKGNLYTMDDLVRARQNEKTLDQKRMIEVLVIGGLVGLGLGLLLGAALSKK